MTHRFTLILLLVQATLLTVLIAQPSSNGQVLASSIPREIEPRGEITDVERRSIELFNRGLDTVEANHELGFAADCRDFRLPAAILQEIGVTQVRLLSNNPRKARALADAGIEIVAEIPCQAPPNPHSFAYLRAKQEKMGHSLGLRRFVGTTHAKNANRPMSTK